MKGFGSTLRKGQVFLMVFLLLLLAGLLVVALSIIWELTVQTNALARDALRVFYLAEAGIERAKTATLYDFWAAGSYPRPVTGGLEDPDGDGWYNDLQPPSPGNYQFRYRFTITNLGVTLDDPGGTQRTIIGRGEVLDNNGNLVASKEIRVTIDGIQDLPVPDFIDDTPADNAVVSWEEQ